MQQAPEMLQTLLADRFGLVVHREKRQTDVYALVVGKPPLRLERKGEPEMSTGDAVTWALSGGPSGVFDATFTVSSEEYMQLRVRAAYNSGMSIPPQMLLQMDTGGAGALEHAVEQMGLRLEPRRLPVDVVVIDAVQREPTDN